MLDGSARQAQAVGVADGRSYHGRQELAAELAERKGSGDEGARQAQEAGEEGARKAQEAER